MAEVQVGGIVRQSDMVRMLRAEQLLGTIFDLALDDMFWLAGRFVPTDEFATSRPLFTEELRLLESMEEEITFWEEAWGRIVALGIVLDFGNGEAPLGPDDYLLHITEDNYARLRY